jgi:Tol biopolymer transport system component/tRNA A-37 threonylcarbamoyl transferase component Bud32
MPERRRQVEQLFHAALEREPGLRNAWLQEACGSDEALRREVEGLLVHAERAEDFIEVPALEIAARELAANPLELSAGQSLGRYRILARLGAGGMGVVYSARDSKLGRTLALKFLKEEFTGDTSAFERFRREARTLSALNHPNICTIYDVAEAEGRSFIAMEFVPGKTLDERIGRKGLKLEEVLKYAAQIADAMAKAHDAGIVHRDLKPTNIIVTDTGQVKLLDFGIAKFARQVLDSESAVTATLSAVTRAHTEEGVIVGTIAYLSPEQAEGMTIDARSDIFAFGAVLYEMLTGVKAFKRESRSATLAAILHEEPKPLHELVPAVPPEVEKLVGRCLRKDPERRLRSMADLGLALRELREESESGRLTASTAAGTPPKSRKNLVWPSALATAAVGALMVTWWTGSHQSQPKAPLKAVPLTTYPGIEKNPSLSPDGSQVAFSWNGEKQQNFDIYVKAIGPGPPLRLTTDPAEDWSPAWSPDGSSIAFLRSVGAGRLSVMLTPALGGVERKLADVWIPDRAWMHGPFLAWLPDSQSLVIADRLPKDGPSVLFSLSMRTGERTQLTFPPLGTIGDGCAAVSPDGSSLAFCRSAGTLGDWTYYVYMAALDRDSKPHGEVRQLTFDREMIDGLTWASDSRRVIYGTGELWTLPVFSGPAGASMGKREKLDLGGGIASPTISRHSSRLAFSRTAGGDQDIWRMRIPEPGGKPEEPVRLIASTRAEFAQQYSPDGGRIAFESARGGNLEIWSCDSEGGSCTQLTWMGTRYNGVPTWSPDGRSIAFYSRVDGKSQIFLVGAEGGAVRRLSSGATNDFYPRWSRSSQWIYFASNRTGMHQVWRMPADGGTAVQVTRNGGFAARESPDGKWLYYTRSENSDSGLWRMPAAGGEETQVLGSVVLHNYDVVEDGVYFIAKSGRELAIQFLDNATRKVRVVAPVRRGYVGFSVSPNRKWILYTQNNPETGELVLVENFR